MRNSILVSVWMVTYNHENYIEQALNSILNQETNFKYKIIIGEDSSQDATAAICLKYAKKYPQKIKLLDNQHNLGPYYNARRVYRSCVASKSKYIAMCEGDDYWTDPLKLQKQVDFLENNPSYAGISTNAEVHYEYSDKASHLFNNQAAKDLTIDDLLEHRPFHTATFLFRSNCLQEDLPKKILSADRTLFMLVACFGKIRFLKEVTAVYRRNEGGISRKVTSKEI